MCRRPMCVRLGSGRAPGSAPAPAHLPLALASPSTERGTRWRPWVRAGLRADRVTWRCLRSGVARGHGRSVGAAPRPRPPPLASANNPLHRVLQAWP
eukprot:scaffold28278_cov26-Tisochrysis_lutea.AAC.8